MRRITSTLFLAVSAIVLTPGLAAAQSDGQDSEAVMEEIVVTGIRLSLQQSLEQKKNAANFVDAINAEDIGKLPDHNIAESLNRIPGVAIQRSRGEGDFVSIRGLGRDFVRGTVNGRTLVSGTEAFDSTLSGGAASSTGRATNFDILPSEIMRSLEVVKSPSAKHVEGGIGGIVNVKTARPLELGTVYGATVEGTYRGFADEFDPGVSGIASWVNEDASMGVLVAATYSERDIREDFSRSFGWLPFGTYDTDGDGMADRTDVIIPLSNNLDTFTESRERVTVSGTLQLSLGEVSSLTVDALYSKRDLQHDQFGVILVALPFGSPSNSDGSFRISPSDLDGNALTTIYGALAPEIISDAQDNDDELLSLGAHFSRDAGEWRFGADLSYSTGEGTLAFDRAVTVGNGQADQGTYAQTYTVDSGGFAVTNTGTASLSNPGNYFVRNGRVTRATNDDEELALQLDLERYVSAGILSSLESGVRYRTRTKERNRLDFDGPLGGFQFTDVPGTPFTPGASDFFDGGWGPFPFGDLIFADAGQTLAEAASQGVDITPRFDPLTSYDIEEETYAGYVQINLASDIGGVPFSGDLGFRVVTTRQNITGQSRAFEIDPSTFPAQIVFTTGLQPVSFSDTYTNALPSLNLRFDLSEELSLRIAASRSLTRPTFESLAPSISINPQATIDLNGDGIAVVGSLGNPRLSPYEATNFDIGLEWYFADTSVVYGALFYKELEDYVASVTNLDVEILGTVFDSATQPDNQGVAQVSGLELGYQHAFESGFGYLANITLTDNAAEFVDGGADIAFPGVSDTSYNLTVYYEMGPWQARLAYSYRNDFLLMPSDVFTNQIYVEEYGQLDGSVSYDINDQLTVVLSAVNLTDEQARLYNEINTAGRRFLSDGIVGPRYAIGVRGSF